MNENEQSPRPVFKTIKSLEKEYGTRNFIEVALKETNDYENIFFSISKGFKTQNDVKRYKNSLGFAASEDLQQFLVDAFKELVDAYKSIPKKEKIVSEIKPVVESTEEKPVTQSTEPKTEEKPIVESEKKTE